MKLLFFLLCPFIVFGQIPTLDVEKRVFDFENILKDQKKLNNLVYSLEKPSNIVVVTTANYFGEVDVVDAVTKLGNQNKVGKGHSGIIVLVSKAKRKTFISGATRIQGVLPDIVCQRLSKLGDSYFKKGDFDGGLTVILTELSKTINTSQAVQEIKTNVQVVESDKKIDLDWLWNTLFVLFSSILAFFGWNESVKSKKRKAEKLAKEVQEKEWSDRREKSRLEEETRKKQELEDWITYKETNKGKVKEFKDKLDSLTAKLRESNKSKFTLSDNYFQNWYDQVSELQGLLMSGNTYSKSKCESLINNLTAYSFENTNSYLNNEYNKLQSKKINLQKSYLLAKTNLNGSQYSKKDLIEDKLENLDSNTNLFGALITCEYLENQYSNIINWQEIKRRKELEEERQRLAEIKRKEESAKQAIIDEENRIKRKKQEEEEESRRSSYSSSSYSSYSSSSDSSSSSSSFSSDSGGSFDGGGGGSDW